MFSEHLVLESRLLPPGTGYCYHPRFTGQDAGGHELEVTQLVNDQGGFELRASVLEPVSFVASQSSVKQNRPC